MPTPSFGGAQQEGAGQSTLGYNQGSLRPENDPNNPEYKARDPRFWQFKNGQWTHISSSGQETGAADARRPGGSGTFGYWVNGLFSGDRNVMGENTAQGQAKIDRAAAEAKAKGEQDAISARMQAFIDNMLGPMDKNDPVYQGLLQAGTDAAQKSAGGAGLSGRSTLAGTQAASVAQQNVMPWMAARQQAGAQMLNQLNNRDISLSNLSLGQQQINNGMAESQANAQRNTMGTVGSLAGGVLGSIYGGPGGGAAGAALGGSLGGVIGGGGAPTYSAPTYRPGSGYKPSGSGY